MSGLIQERDLFATLLDHMPSTYDDAPVVFALVDVIAGEYDEMHQDVLDLQGGHILADAKGWHLQQWADRFREPAEGLADAPLRRFIEARRLTNRSSGEPDRLATIAQLLYGATHVAIVRVSTSQLALYVYRSVLAGAAFNYRAFAQLISAAPAGDHLGPLAIVPVGYFGWSEDADAEGWGVGIWAEAA